MDKKLLENSMQKLQTGDISALDNIYALTSKAVYYLAYSILKNSEHAKDIMHDTYIRIIKNIDKYRLNTNAAAWILCMARNLSFNEYSKLQRSIGLEILEENLTDSRDCFAEMEGFFYIKKAINFLSVNEREIVMLFAVGNFKHREIAKIVGKPIGTVQWIYNKAIKKLRLQIEKESDKNASKFVFEIMPEFEKKVGGKLNER